jgi:hypothetical protein
VVVPEYDERTIMMGDDSNSTLLAAQYYLLQVLSANVRMIPTQSNPPFRSPSHAFTLQADVRQFTALHPFSPHIDYSSPLSITRPISITDSPILAPSAGHTTTKAGLNRLPSKLTLSINTEVEEADTDAAPLSARGKSLAQRFMTALKRPRIWHGRSKGASKGVKGVAKSGSCSARGSGRSTSFDSFQAPEDDKSRTPLSCRPADGSYDGSSHPQTPQTPKQLLSARGKVLLMATLLEKDSSWSWGDPLVTDRVRAAAPLPAISDLPETADCPSTVIGERSNQRSKSVSIHRSFGVIPYTTKAVSSKRQSAPTVHFLLVKQRNGSFWGFPKVKI